MRKHVNSCIDTAEPTTISPTQPKTPKAKLVAPASTTNAFSLLMSGRKEVDAWKIAEMDHAKAGTDAAKQRSQGGRRKAPFYKVNICFIMIRV